MEAADCCSQKKDEDHAGKIELAGWRGKGLWGMEEVRKMAMGKCKSKSCLKSRSLIWVICCRQGKCLFYYL